MNRPQHGHRRSLQPNRGFLAGNRIKISTGASSIVEANSASICVGEEEILTSIFVLAPAASRAASGTQLAHAEVIAHVRCDSGDEY